MGVGVIRISRRAVGDMLRLPSAYAVLACFVDPHRDELVVQVASEAIPAVEECELLPLVTPMYQQSEDGSIRCAEVVVARSQNVA